MVQERSKMNRPMQAESDADEGSQIDYSYNQWRHASMRQRERDYELECERNLRLA